jgi:hypothetical protein
MFNHLADVLIFVAGGTFMWFAKTSIQKIVLGANALSAKLHADATALEAASVAKKTTVAAAAVKKA